MKIFVSIVLSLGGIVRPHAQTIIDLRRRARDINFRNASATTPWKTSAKARRVLVFLFAASAFAGQSVVMTANSAGNGSVPAMSVSANCTVEFMLHDWDSAQTAGTIIPDNVCGVAAQFVYLPNLTLYMYWMRGTGGGGYYFDLTSLPSRMAYVRFVVYGANKWTAMEVWDASGASHATGYVPYDFYASSSGANPNGFTIQGTDTVKSFAVGFAKVKNVAVPYGSAMPSSYDNANTLVNWKFDGNGTDASGNGYTATISGTPSYGSQAGQTLVKANVGTAIPTGYGTNYPVYNRSGWVSLKAGGSNALDLSQSVSQADNGALTYNLAVTAGPTTPTVTGSTTVSPSIDSCVFGDYTFHLVVTDGASQTGTVDQHMGCVAYDANGVVQPANPNVTKIYGPMIAYGQSPWAKMDERGLAMVGLQTAYFNNLGLNPPGWVTTGQGTVSYQFSGRGTGFGPAGTTLTSGITATDTSIPIAEASVLSLSSLPTWILIGNGWGPWETICISGTTATSGPATLTVCYNGRGLSGMGAGGSETVAAQSWSGGTAVGEMRIAGTGTQFGTDASRPLCPAGLPGPPGAVVYSTGTVSLTGSSTTITGSGTAWTSAMAGGFIRIAATHASGTAFIYWSRIASVAGGTSLTVDRALPADVDAGPFSYQITSQRWVSLEFAAPDGATQRGLQGLAGCQSETAAFAKPLHDVTPLNSTNQSGAKYSTYDALGAQSAFGPNFYGSGLALRAFYYRSGLQAALDAANIMDEYWIRGPEIGAGWFGGGLYLLTGGGVIGAIADKVLNASTALDWKDIRHFGTIGSIGSAGCNNMDSRDSGYAAAWPTLLMLFDTAQQATWTTAVSALLTRDQSCKQPDNSWANGAQWVNTAWQGARDVALSLTNGSAIATGSGIPSGACYGVGQQTITLTNGSAAVTATSGTFNSNANSLFITGTRSGQVFNARYAFTRTDATHGTLDALWPGDSAPAASLDTSSVAAGNVPAFDFIGGIGEMATIASSPDPAVDPQIRKNWECIWNSSTQVTLNRNWDGTTGTRNMRRYVLNGFGQQPYMLGIKTTVFRWGALSANSTIANGYDALRPLSSTWIHDVGYDGTQTKGMHYGRVFEQCEPPADPNGNHQYRNIPCAFGMDPNWIRQARGLTAETSSALYGYYDAQSGAAPSVSWGDEAFGAVWGFPPWTQAGLYADAYYVRDELFDTQLGGHKWPGFFFGMGAAHQWPAVRLGAPASPANQSNGATITGAVFQ